MDDDTTLPERFAPERLLAHAGWVRVMAGHLLVDPSAADDLAQESLLRAMRGRPANPEQPRGWLTAIVRNTLRRTHRVEEQRAAREQLVAPREALPSAAELAARASVHRAVVDAVLALPEPYRATLLLRFFEEMQTSEIARRRGEPVETVRTRLKRGLAQLRERLARELDVETASGARRRGMDALVLLVQPAGGGAAAIGASASAAGIGGVAAMAISAKTVATVAIVAAGAWWAWTRGDGPADRQVEKTAAEHGAPIVAARETPQAIRNEAVVESEPEGAASSAAATDAPLRLASLRNELTNSNLLEGNKVVDDLGVEMRAALQGLMTETLDLAALLEYVESREASSWVVRDSLESTKKPTEEEVHWTQAYENSNGTGSVYFVAATTESSGAGSVSLQAMLFAWARDFDPVLGDARAIAPMLTLNVFEQSSGTLSGILILHLQPKMQKQQPLANDRFDELRAAGRLPPLVNLKFDGAAGQLEYYRHGANEMKDDDRLSSRPLTVREIAALRRIYDRYHELAKQHVADAGKKPGAAK